MIKSGLRERPKTKPYCPDLIKGHVNVSHHGDWVVLASDHERSVGVDVMKFEEPRRGRETFFNSMQRQFTAHEWNAIEGSLERFYTFWALKESYIKGIGIGLGFNLQRISFTVDKNTATVDIDGKPEEAWEFNLAALDSNHVVAIALGPPKTAESSSPITKFDVMSVDDVLRLLTGRV